MFEAAHYDELKTKLFTDPMRLDEELVQHPMLLMEAIEFTTISMRVRDAAKNDLDTVTAEATVRLRQPERDGKMPSEAKISSLVPLDPFLAAARDEYEEAKADCALWSGLVDAFRQKGSSLKHYAELTVAGFLAPNTVRRQEMAEKRKPSNNAGGDV